MELKINIELKETETELNRNDILENLGQAISNGLFDINDNSVESFSYSLSSIEESVLLNKIKAFIETAQFLENNSKSEHEFEVNNFLLSCLNEIQESVSLRPLLEEYVFNFNPSDDAEYSAVHSLVQLSEDYFLNMELSSLEDYSVILKP